MDITASSGLIECLHCATSNDDLAKFCVRCGQRLLLVPPEPAKAPARAVCVRCGQVNRPGALLCAACGIPIQNYAALVPRVKRDDVGAGARTPQAATATVASTTASPPPVAKGSAASASVDSRAPRPPASMPAPAAAKSPIAPAPPSRAPAPSASPAAARTAPTPPDNLSATRDNAMPLRGERSMVGPAAFGVFVVALGAAATLWYRSANPPAPSASARAPVAASAPIATQSVAPPDTALPSNTGTASAEPAAQPAPLTAASVAAPSAAPAANASTAPIRPSALQRQAKPSPEPAAPAEALSADDRAAIQRAMAARERLRQDAILKAATEPPQRDAQ